MGPDVPARPLTEEPAKPRNLGSGSPGSRPGLPLFREYVEVVLLAVVLALFARTFLFQAFVVPSPSMERTVLVGDHVVVNKFVFAPHTDSPLARLLPYRRVRRGDLIVFKFPEDPQRDFIKRVVALPGDVLEIHNRTVFVNGVGENDGFLLHSDKPTPPDNGKHSEARRPPGWYGPSRIPSGGYFAMGDNRDNSYDSRFWGPVPAANLKGRALFIYWSFPTDSTWRQGSPFRRIAGFFLETRWPRIFQLVR